MHPADSEAPNRLPTLFLLLPLLVAFLLLPDRPANADVRLPAVIGDHMVLQRDRPLPIWGWAEPGEDIVVDLAGQRYRAKADGDGAWRVTLDPLSLTTKALTMRVTGANKIELRDILVGEVWLCSGQSNMQWPVSASKDADLEASSAHYPRIRFLTVDTPGTQKSNHDFDGQWESCTPEKARDFSAVGYFFGRELQQQLGVPVGLIDNAWGGSSCEAWVRRDLLEGKPLYEALLERWAETERTFDYEAALKTYETELEQWEKQAAEARETGRRPRRPQNVLANQHRPANLYHGRLKPVMPFGIRGCIWYQGESNASRAYQYRDLFPLMIHNWRTDWGQGDFPFYWVQLADFKDEVAQPGESSWAELREAQTMTLDKLPRTGQAVIIDLGEASDIHPRNKQDVARRLARLALSQEYGVDLASQSPRFALAEAKGSKMLVTFRDFQGRLRTVDARELEGFAVAGEDRQWHHAQARITGRNQVEVWSGKVSAPVAVRYGWADNSICNLYTDDLLPVTPFRSDNWPGVTQDAR